MPRIEIIAHESLRQLSAQFQRLLQEVGNLRRRQTAFRCELEEMSANSVATTDTIIPARSGTTPGGPIQCQRKRLSGLPTTPVFVDDGDEVDVYSWVKSDSSDPADEDGGLLWIFIEQDIHGVWWFTGQDCPPAA